MQDGVVQKAKCVLSIDLSKSSGFFKTSVSENCSHLNKKKAKNTIFLRPVNSKITTEKKNEGKMEGAEEGKKKGRKEKKVVRLILSQPRYFTSRHKFHHNRPFLSSPGPLFQNEGRC